MNKVDFPLGVELPLRGGGVAVLYENVDGDWFGRYRKSPRSAWYGAQWACGGGFGGDSDDLDILKPKRKAWVCWTPNDGATLFKDELAVMAIKANSPEFKWQEITEP